ncbi:MAG: EAL domain-containing protein, partial [Acetobacterales bacterium]
QRDRFLAFAFASADVLIETDAKGRIQYCAGATENLFGFSVDALVGQSLLRLVAPEDQVMVEAAMARLRATGRIERLSIGMRHRSGGLTMAELNGIMLPQRPDVCSLVLRYARAGSGFTHGLEEAGHALSKGSFLDLARSRVAEAKARAETYQLTMLDLDDGAFFDRLGAKGAEDFAENVEGQLRAWSVAGASVGRIATGPSGEVTRYGVIHDGSVKAEHLEQRIGALAAKADPTGAGIEVRSSSLSFEAGELSSEEMVQAVAYAINKFAAGGDAQMGFGTLAEGYKAMLDETITRVRSFRKLTESDQFRFVYQPVVSLQQWQVHHFEVLSRFDKNDDGKSPYDTLVFAEDIGLVSEFDLAVLRKAIEVLKGDGHPRGMPLAVNVSGRSLLNQRFVSELLALLGRNRALMNVLMFEITESFEIKDLTTANKLLQEIRRRGFKVCLDDFGAGAAAFQYLRNLQIDFVKIDGSYLHDAFASPFGKSFLRAIANLCSDLKLRTIGEMVEDQLALDLLSQIGVDMGQGYFLGTPMPTPGPVELPARAKVRRQSPGA